MRVSGTFITFEGSEGAGKSTQLDQLASRLRTAGRRVRVVREPGGTALGEEVRHILKHAAYGEKISDTAELLLFAASRAQLVSEVVRPALQAGEVVLSDRFTDSSVAYQGYGRGVALDFITRLNQFATGGLAPAMTVLLELPAQEGMARARQRVTTTHPDRMETMEMAFYDRVCQGYQALADGEPARFFVLDARADSSAIAEKIWQEFQRRQL